MTDYDVVERQLSCAAFGFGRQERATEMNEAIIAFIRGALPRL